MHAGSQDSPRRSEDAATDDLELRLRIPRRDPQALAKVFDLYGEALIRHALPILPPGMEAQDAAQEVMVRFIEGASHYDPRRPLYPYLARICTNVCLNERRSLRRMLGAFLGWRRSRSSATDDGVPEKKRFWLVCAVQRLSERELEAVSLRYLFEVGRDELAALLGVDADSVKRTLTRALAHLREGADGGRLEDLMSAGEEEQ